MGIGGLLPLLKEIQNPSHVRDWKGKTVAVDGYVWLHRGAYGCAEDLALGRKTVKYVNYAMHRVRMLKYYGVTPMLVFDGGLLPSKMGTEDDRERRRNEALAKGRAFLAEGKASQARECFVKAVDVTPEMAFQLIKALRREGVQYVVAPYEADPQLCYLEKHGLVDAIVTEDSDLLVFGCRNVLFKMDGEGNCVSISRDDFSKCREYNLAGWSDVEFRQMAILSGCDYADSIAGLGLKTAYKLMRKYKTAEKVIQFVRLEGQLNVPRDYLDTFRRAELTFLHQHVFDPVSRKLTHLHPLPDNLSLDDLPFIGPLLEDSFACGLADGDIDPISKAAMVDLIPDAFSPEKPFKAEPFKVGASSSSSSKPAKGKAAPEPVKGAGSILSFFSRQSPATASTSTAVNPVKTVANQRRLQLVEQGKGKENEASAARGVASKFFGKGAKVAVDVKGKGKERENELDEDEEAQAALNDVEMVESVAAESVTVVSLVEDDSPAEDGVTTVATNRSTKTRPSPPSPAKPTPLTPSRPSLREPSLPSCISSPSSTPPPRKHVKRSHSSQDGLRLAKLVEHDEGDYLTDVGGPTDAGVSSPATSVRADAGWAEEDEGLSSPVAGPSHSKPSSRAQPPPPSSKRVKVEPREEQDVKPLVDSAGGKGKKPTIAIVELSSDPIVLSSDACEPAPPEQDEEERTPRPASRPPKKLPRQPKEPAKSPEGKSKARLRRERRSSAATVEVREDEPSSGGAGGKGQGRGKKRAKKEEEKVEEVDEAVQKVAASWRAKFMMPTASKTPTGKTPFGRSLFPTPTTTTRPPSLDKPSSSTEKRARTPATTSNTARRTPLSPKSTNRVDRRPLLKPASPLKKRTSTLSSSSQEDDEPVRSSLSPAKKRRTSILTDVSASSTSQKKEVNPPSDAVTAGGASSSPPVVVTNPRLLAFKFKGTVKRD
ncbi:hypothetical protein JCM8547_000473 [Rhodosporidiobolus lusitaniae]